MKKILVVDDSETLLGSLKEKFDAHENIEVIYAQSYSQALKIMRKEHKNIGVALLDVNLPDAPDGQIISLVKSNDIPIIVLTGTLNKKVREKIQKQSIISYILKNKPSSIDLAVKTAISTLQNYKKTILIVDDSQAFRMSLRLTLEMMNLNVIEVESGAKALEVLEDTKRDIPIVIVDYNMPTMNGLDLTIKIRELYDKNKLGILAVSSHDEKDLIDDFLTFGANDFIDKSFTTREIIAKVNATLELLDLFKQITDLANKDFLTGTYNRRYFFDAGKAIFLKAKRKGSFVAVIMLDIDNFKNINDIFGHDVGDIAIKEVKKVLDKNLRSSDLVARFGGEEFCILLEDITVEDSKKLFEKIRQEFEDNVININGVQVQYTVSFGIGYGMLDSLEKMIKLSDEALYYSKENGRNQVSIKKS